jgi:hypothetical protein
MDIDIIAGFNLAVFAFPDSALNGFYTAFLKAKIGFRSVIFMCFHSL